MTIRPIVSIDHISFIRNGTAVLDDITLTITPGQHWAIIGPNGSGKTSLISIINGYHQPSKGRVEVLGYRFGSADLRELRRRIGECSSEIRNLIHPGDHVLNIVLSGRFGSIGLYERPETSDLKRAQELIDGMGLSRFTHQAFRLLSLGEQQKVIIARALMSEPEILVLDEPCEGLDIKAREQLLGSVQGMCTRPGGPSLISITHRIEEIIPAVTHAAALKQGRVAAQGPKEDILTAEILSGIFDMPIEIYHESGRYWPMIVRNQPDSAFGQ